MSPVERLQWDVAGFAASVPMLADAGILVERPRKTEAERTEYLQAWDQAMSGVLGRNGKMGLTAMVLMPTLPVHAGSGPGPRFDPEILVRFIEIVELNLQTATGTLVSAEDAAMSLASAIQNWHHGKSTITVSPEGAVPVVLEDLKDVAVTYDLKLRSVLQLGQPGRAAAPRIVVDAGQLQLTCSTPGAVIYFTTDGGFPGAFNTGATVYAAPVDGVASGTVIRAAAYADGLVGSFIASALAP